MCLRSICFLLFATSFLPVTTHGQIPHDIAKVKTQTLKYDSSNQVFDFSLPFSKIEIIDYRFDTSKIGYAIYNKPENHTKLVVPGGVREFLTMRLNASLKNYMQSTAPATLVIVLKKLWLEYASVNELLRSKDIKDESLLRAYNRNTFCFSDMDVVVKTEDSYQALIRLTYNFTREEAGRYSDFHLLMMPFDSLINKILSIDVAAALTNKKKFSLDELHVNYGKRFDIPILTSDSLHRGIFLSFADFKKNKPSYPDFKYKIFELSTELTIEQDGKGVAITDYWGFFTGKDLYVKPGFLPFRVVRQGNTFDMLGTMRSKRKEGSIQLYSGFSIPTSTVSTVLYPFQVDMETGNVY
jgi:hypothetical protein